MTYVKYKIHTFFFKIYLLMYRCVVVLNICTTILRFHHFESIANLVPVRNSGVVRRNRPLIPAKFYYQILFVQKSDHD